MDLFLGIRGDIDRRSAYSLSTCVLRRGFCGMHVSHAEHNRRWLDIVREAIAAACCHADVAAPRHRRRSTKRQNELEREGIMRRIAEERAEREAAMPRSCGSALAQSPAVFMCVAAWGA